MCEAASLPIPGYRPAPAPSRLVQEERSHHSLAEILSPVKPAPISSGPAFYITCYANMRKRKDSAPLSLFLRASQTCI